MEQARAQALQHLLMEQQVSGEGTDRKVWSAYRQAIAARNHAEQVVSRASIAQAVARRALAAAREREDAPDSLTQAQGALEAASRQLDQAQAAYTQARLNVEQLWANIRKSAPRVFTPYVDPARWCPGTRD